MASAQFITGIESAACGLELMGSNFTMDFMLAVPGEFLQFPEEFATIALIFAVHYTFQLSSNWAK